MISGGEPVVQLAPAEVARAGGRNQQLVLAAAEVLATAKCSCFVLASGGTDGEDGPTDAAGAIVDRAILNEAALAGCESRISSAATTRITFSSRSTG